MLAIQGLHSLGLVGLFFGTFLAATLLPLSSGPLTLAMLKAQFPFLAVLIVATLGNTLGGVFNYWLGYKFNLKWAHRFGFHPRRLESFEKWLKRLGPFLAFFTWLPIIGDLFALFLGHFKVPLKPVCIMMLLGRVAHYLIWMYPFYALGNGHF